MKIEGIKNFFEIGIKTGSTPVIPEKKVVVQEPSDSFSHSSLSSHSGEVQKQEKGDDSPEKKIVDPSEYHYTPPYPITYNAQRGYWEMKLPNAVVPVPRKPLWLETSEKINGILDKSADPLLLRKLTDDIKSIADKSHDSTNNSLDDTELKAYILKIDDIEMLKSLKQIYKLRLDNETNSTGQVGGAMAGSLCSEMSKLSNIMRILSGKM